MADNESTSVTKDLGIVSAYGYAKAAGYTGTEEEFEEIFLEFTENAPGLLDRLDEAVDDAEAAETAAAAANTAAQAAKTAAENAAATFETDTTLLVSGKAADAKVTGDEITGLKTAISENTRNLIFAKRTGVGITSNGGMEYTPNFDVHIAPVTANKKYTLLSDESNANGAFYVYAIYSEYPSSSSVPHSTRYISTNPVITVDSSGYIILRSTAGFTKAQVAEGETVTEYIPHTTAMDFVARESIEHIVHKEPYSANDIHLQYDIDEDGHYTKGWLKLPSNYTPYGKPVPLIVFVHGSADFPNINSNMTDNYNTYYNYLRDCGYAVFDCFAYGNLFVTNGANTWGTPTNNRCYQKGIEYVTENYNIDKSGVFVACKSLGGIQAFSMFHSPMFNIKAVGMLAPQLDPIYADCGYSKNQRHAYLVDTGMLADTGSVFDTATITKNEDYIAYMQSNAFVFAGGDPSFVGNVYDIDDKIENAITNSDNRYIAELPTFSLNRPLKIWIAADDQAVSYTNSQRLIASLNLAGMRGILRTMPSGTGGHHSVDDDENAPQQTNVTTRLGIEYASVPLAYYELEQFFSMFI